MTMNDHIVCIIGPDTVDYDPPIHDCDDKRGNPHWEAAAWLARGARQTKCPKCKLYGWTRPTR
jgi:hypothetical protein